MISAIRRVVFPSAQNALTRVLQQKGVAAALTLHREMAARYPIELLHEFTLNALGYAELREGRVDPAIEIFKRNVESYPRSFNPYDSLAEAYMAKGNHPAAIENYRKALALNPEHTHAVRMIEKLEAPTP